MYGEITPLNRSVTLAETDSMQVKDNHTPSTIMPPAHMHILVGIDLGFTCTGVAFTTTDWDESLHIVKIWPGNDEVNYKVPTVIEYRAGNRKITAWGFGCIQDPEVRYGVGVKELFKLHLDQKFLNDTFGKNPTIAVGDYDDVQMWYLDFLKALYQYIHKYIMEELKIADWTNHTIQFLFSYPTTWDNVVVAEYERIIREAGFGSDGKRHNVEIQLTEADAAVVYTADCIRHRKELSPLTRNSKSNEEPYNVEEDIKEGDVILVCDSGGGTTDISVVMVDSLKPVDEHSKSDDGMLIQLEPLGEPIKGLPIGSVQIDHAFQDEFENRLKTIVREDSSIKPLSNIASPAVKRQFQGIKLLVGTGGETRSCRFEIAGLSGFTRSESRIENGQMKFSREDIRELFDRKIRGIFALIDEQIETHKIITHLVLSGGLCSSEYVQQRIRESYGNMKILIGDQPQLAVCKGLVLDSLYRLRYNAFILPSRCIRYSYGILSAEPFNKSKHQLQKKHVQKNPTNGEGYATEQIYWIIHHGQVVRTSRSETYKFYRIVDTENVELMWKDKIVTSIAPTASRLPQSIHDGDATEVCELESRMSLIEIKNLEQEGLIERKRRNRFGFRPAREFWKIEHDLVVYLNTSNLNFEMYVGSHRIGDCSVPVDFILAREKLIEEGENQYPDDSDTSADGISAFHSLIPVKLDKGKQRD